MPGLRKCLLGFRAKRFGEQYHHLQQRRRSNSKGSSLRGSQDSLITSSMSNLNMNGGAQQPGAESGNGAVNNISVADGDDEGMWSSCSLC